MKKIHSLIFFGSVFIIANTCFAADEDPISVTTVPDPLPSTVCTKQQNSVTYILTNNASNPLTIKSITDNFSDGNFWHDNECSNTRLDPTKTCNYIVKFESDTPDNKASAKPTVSYGNNNVPLSPWKFSAQNCTVKVTGSVDKALPANMAVGDSAPVSFKFKNTGNSSATKVKVTLDPAGLADVNDTCSGKSLDASKDCTVSASFAPTSGEPQTQTVTASFSYAESKDPASASSSTTVGTVTVSGTTETNLPTYTSSGQPYSVKFSFKNNSTALSATEVAVTTDPKSDFSQLAGSCTTNKTIVANTSCDVTATVTPSAKATTKETATVSLSYQESTTPATASTETTVDNTLLISVGDNSTLLRSTDGNDWLSITAGIPANTILMGVAANNTGKQLIVTGNNGVILSSMDGKTWSSQTSSTTKEMPAVTWSDEFSQYIAVGDNTILTSADGAKWTSQSFPSGASELDDLVCPKGQKQCVAVGQMGTIVTSSDSTAWTESDSGSKLTLTRIIWDGNQYLVIGSDLTSGLSKILSSGNANHWSITHMSDSAGCVAIAWSPSLKLYIAVGSNGSVMNSADANAWTAETAIANAGNLNKVVWDDAIQSFIIAGDSGKLFTSTDGKTWAPVTSNTATANLKGLGKTLVKTSGKKQQEE